MPYLTLCAISQPAANGNTMGEAPGNVLALQHLQIGEDTVTVLSGTSQRRCYRQNTAGMVGEDKMFRHHDAHPEAPSGYGYGPQNQGSLHAGLVDLEMDKSRLLEFYDAHYGIMDAPKSGTGMKFRSSIATALGFSTTSFDDLALFQQGVNAANGDLAPYQHPIHVTRYVLRQTYNVEDFRDHLEKFYVAIRAFCDGIRVGGHQSQCSNVVVPDVIMWRTTKVPGRTGLNHVGYRTPVGQAPDITMFLERAQNNRQPFRMAGTFRYDTEKVTDSNLEVALDDSKDTPLWRVADLAFLKALALLDFDEESAKGILDAAKALIQE